MKKIIALIFIFLMMTGVASATISTTVNNVSYVCAGTTGPFAFTFPVTPDGTALIVTEKDLSGNTTTLNYSTDYTTASVNNSYLNGGTVTLTVACTSGYTLKILRSTPETQLSSFTDGMPTLYKTFERALDKVTMIVQDNAGGGYAPLNSPTFTGTVTFPITGSTQCLHVSGAGVVSGTGSDCGSGGGGGGNVYTHGTPTANQLGMWYDSTHIAGVTLSQDCTITSAGVITCLKSNNVAFGTGAFATIANYATLASPTFTGIVTVPSYSAATSGLTIGTTQVQATGTQLNYLALATGTTGTSSTSLVYSTSPLLTTPTLTAATLNGTTTFGALTGTTQCLHVNSSGVLSATGADCGSGGGGANASGYYVVTQSTSEPANAVNLGALTTGLLKMAVSGGIATLSTASSSSDYEAYNVNLASIANLANSSVFLKNDGSGNFSYSSSSSTPGGSDTQAQYNNAGVLAGMSAMTYDKNTTIVYISGTLSDSSGLSSGQSTGLGIVRTYTYGGTTYDGYGIISDVTAAVANSNVEISGIESNVLVTSNVNTAGIYGGEFQVFKNSSGGAAPNAGNTIVFDAILVSQVDPGGTPLYGVGIRAYSGDISPYTLNNVRQYAGFLAEGNKGWKYPFLALDTDNSTALFDVDQNGAGYFKSNVGIGGTLHVVSTVQLDSLSGILVGNGASVVTTITDNHTNWDAAYSQRLQWDGGSTNLVAATGRTSLGLNIGSDVQAYNANLTGINQGLATNSNVQFNFVYTGGGIGIGGDPGGSAGQFRPTNVFTVYSNGTGQTAPYSVTGSTPPGFYGWGKVYYGGNTYYIPLYGTIQ